MKTKDLTLVSVCTALMCVLSPISIPLAGGVPISLATFVIMVTGVVLKEIKATTVVLLYLILGLIGLPVYSGFTSGASTLFGMTGGYFFGYLILAFVTGKASSMSEGKEGKTRVMYLITGMLIGNVLLYIVGTAYFMIFTGMNLGSSLVACVIPFLPGDIIKMIITVIIAPRIEKIAER